MARRYGVAAQAPRGCGGTVGKEFLQSKGVGLTTFSTYHNNSPAYRRRLLWGMGGKITFSVARTNSELNNKINEKIESGVFMLGEHIVPKWFKKLVIDKAGNISTVEFIVHGRKIPLETLRKRMIEHQEKQGVFRIKSNEEYNEMAPPDISRRLEELCERKVASSTSSNFKRDYLKRIERTRHLLAWGDHSSILNHGYLLYMISAVYDPAIFITNEKAKARNLTVDDIQAVVEKPQIHIMARTGGSEIEQIAYMNTRNECIRALPVPLKTASGIEINDVMRFFGGDNPER